MAGMKKRRKGYTIFRALKTGGHLLVLGGSFLGAFRVLEDLGHGRPLPLAVLYLVLLEGFWLLLEAGDVEQRRFLDLMYSQFFGAAAASLFFGALMCAVSSLSMWQILGEFFLLLVLQSGAGMAWAALCFGLYLRGQSHKRALFIYGEREEPEEITEKNNRINGYFHIAASVPCREAAKRPGEVLGGYQAVYLGDLPPGDKGAILEQCMIMEKDCYSIPGLIDVYTQNARILRLQDKVLFQYHKGGLTAGQKKAKRALDIGVALALLALSAPLMLVIALCVRLEDGGPVLYRQIRYTEGGRPFRMLKFRSMHVDAEREGARLASRNDSRITRVGRIIRNLHFDELPQLVNVLKGDMSMVGPRPERREFIEEYSRVIPEFSQRMKVKGGLTGYAQIYGKYNTGPEDKIKYDLIYIYNYSLRLDVRLLFLTVRILFQKESAEGVEEGRRSAVRERKERQDGDDQTS